MGVRQRAGRWAGLRRAPESGQVLHIARNKLSMIATRGRQFALRVCRVEVIIDPCVVPSEKWNRARNLGGRNETKHALGLANPCSRFPSWIRGIEVMAVWAQPAIECSRSGCAFVEQAERSAFKKIPQQFDGLLRCKRRRPRIQGRGRTCPRSECAK